MAVVSESGTYKLRQNETKDGGILLCGKGKGIDYGSLRLLVAFWADTYPFHAGQGYLSRRWSTLCGR